MKRAFKLLLTIGGLVAVVVGVEAIVGSFRRMANSEAHPERADWL